VSLSRRAFLGRIGAGAAGAAALGVLGRPAFAAGRPLVRPRAGGPLATTIVNNSGNYANSSVWFYIVGTNLGTGAQSYVAPDGTLTAVSASDNGSDGYADLSIPLAGSGNTTINLPANMSGRVYFSLGDKLKFKVVTDGSGNAALQYPAGWVSSDPSYSVMHDWIEFTYNDGGMYCNTTMVDMFSVPLAINLAGSANQTTGTLVSGGRANIFSGIAANSDYAPLIVNNDLRVIAPGHGIDSGIFSSTYFDDYINQVWSQYTGSTLTVTTNAGAYTGQVSGSTLNFSGGVAPFNKPTTLDAFYCNGALAAPNDGVTGPVAAVLGAAINRGTLLSNSSQPTTDASAFYTNAVSNHYSQVMHQNTQDGKAYGFPFDDVASFAAYVQDGAPSSWTLTLTPF
jgi:hypothetical protein